VSGGLRRLRAYPGHWGLLAALALIAGLLAAGVPRLANEFTDRGLRGDVERLPHSVRDVTYRGDPQLTMPPGAALAQLPVIESGLPGPLSGLIADRWASVQVGPQALSATGPGEFARICAPQLQLRTQSGLDRAVRLVAGRLPGPGPAIESVLSREAAAAAKLGVGDRLMVAGPAGRSPVLIVGVFEPVDPAGPFWDDQRPEKVVCPGKTGQDEDSPTVRITLLTDVAGIRRGGELAPLAYRWRYHIDAGRLSAADIPALSGALLTARLQPPLPGVTFDSGLGQALATFAAEVRGAQATLAVVQAGLLATLAGLILLASLLTVDRRRPEFALLRARGATALRVGLRTVAEALLVMPVALAAGWGLSALLPGRPDDTEPLLLTGLLLLAVLAGPVLATQVRGERGRARLRPSARRLTAEAFVLVVAVLGVVLVRRRGLGGAVDPYLALVPVLLAVGAALVAVHLLPWPLRQLARVTARGRGAVPFLGLARAGRGAAVHAGPMAILVVAIATGVFAAAVSSTVDSARDRATDLEVAADAAVLGFGFGPGTDRLLTAVPGVTAAVPLLVSPGAPITSAAGLRAQAQLLVVDGSAADRVLARSRVGVRMPAALSAPASAGPVPVVVSPEVAAELGDGGVLTVQGRRYDVRVAAVATSVPGLQVGARRFIAVSRQALPVPTDQPLVPTRYLIAGDGFDPAAVRRAADAGQREYYLGLLQRTINANATEVTDAQLPRRAEVTTWAQHRQSLQDSGANAVLSFSFAAGAAGAATLALLAVGLTVLADAPGRGRALSRLRTMGLSAGQGRRLLGYELVPLIGTAVLAGGLVGVLLPGLVGPALGLTAFTAGLPADARVDPWLPVAALLLVAAALAVAMTVESLANRRMRLGEALRLGEEN
jgi:putative ABC transport system permease protein